MGARSACARSLNLRPNRTLYRRILLRETLKVTQEELADKLRVTQVAVSRLERRSDMHLSTLRQFVRALGGELEIRAVFAGRSVKLTHIGTAGVAKHKSRPRR
jgi:predicted transcriptional regulator